jgi:methylmalonyl-CoA mutase N-terminal domain/subunit
MGDVVSTGSTGGSGSTDDSGAGARSRWQERYDRSRVRDADFSTLSGMTVAPAYGTETSEWPGEFPFTRGLYPTGYRGRTWTIRQFAGFGNAQQTNERYRMILGRGGGGLSVAFDMPTLMGRDSDDAQSLGEVGHCGVAIDSAADMDVLFDSIPLEDVTTSSRPSVRARTCRSSTAPCRPTSSRSTSRRRSGSSRPSRTCV